MSDLGELDVQASRARQKRSGAVARAGVGASRVGARSTVVEMPPAPAPEDDAPASPAKKLAAAPSPAKPVKQLAEPPSQSTISLDRKSDELLEAVRTAGRLGRPKVDANRSATIRLALALLGEQMTPDQIAAELRRRTRPSGAGGRPRLG